MNRISLGLFWSWIRERERIRKNKEAGKPYPWTADPIFQKYRFTNVYRQLDRTTIELNERIHPNFKKGMDLVLFNIILFRLFNWTETYDLMGGWQKTWSEKKTERVSKKLHKHSKNGGKVFTGAYIITNNGMKCDKIDLYLEASMYAWNMRKHLLTEIYRAASMEASVEICRLLPMAGNFVGYELTCDFRYTPILDKATDIMTWANPGPGAMRGLNRIFRGNVKKKPDGKDKRNIYVKEMQQLLKKSRSQLRLLKIPLEMREIEHSLCEYDKYMRVAQGEGRPRSIYPLWRSL